jgi:hypothetical protein
MKNAVFWDVAPCGYCVNRLSEEHIPSIFRVEKSASEEPAWAGVCRPKRQGTRDPHGATSQKTAFFIIKSCLRNCQNCAEYNLIWHVDTMRTSATPVGCPVTRDVGSQGRPATQKLTPLLHMRRKNWQSDNGVTRPLGCARLQHVLSAITWTGNRSGTVPTCSTLPQNATSWARLKGPALKRQSIEWYPAAYEGTPPARLRLCYCTDICQYYWYAYICCWI